MGKRFLGISSFNIALCVLVIFAYVGIPPVMPKFEDQKILTLTGVPVFTRVVPTKNSGSGTVLRVANTIFYCGAGITQGDGSCGLDTILDKGNPVTVKYFLMPTRLGTDYPLIYSINQKGAQKVSPNFMQEQFKNSLKGAWNRYFVILSFFALLAVFLFVTNSLRGDNEK